MSSLNHEEVAQIAEKVAELTLSRFGKLLGVDIDDTEQMNEFRADLVHARRMRRCSENAVRWSVYGFLTAAGGATLLLFLDNIKAAFK